MDNKDSGRGAMLVGVMSSILTIVLTLFNTYTTAKIDAADLSLKQQTSEFEMKLKERSADLEQSRDKITRYTFVHTLFPDLSGDAHKQELTVNLIRLSLADDEAAKLFAGLSGSHDKSVRYAGSAGITIISREKNNLQDAREKEREGFQSLVDGKYADAASAFEASERAYPTYHWVYELGRLLRTRKERWNDPSKMKPALQQIVTDYAYGAPADLLEQLRAKAK